MKCVVCENEIPKIQLFGHSFYEGVVSEVVPNYGSQFDSDRIKIGICDNCLKKSEDKKTIEILSKGF